MVVLSSTETALLTLFLESLLYGVFLTLYLISLFILRAKTGIQRQFLISVTTLQLCIATASVIISFVRPLQAFVFDAQTISVDAYFFNLSSPLNLAQTALFVTQTALGDGVIIWRCYVVNHRSLWVAIPGYIALLTNAAIGCYVIWTLSRLPAGSAISTTADRFTTTFYTLTMVISVTCSSLIAWRIYRGPSFMPGGSRSLLPVFIVIIETGALYAMSVLALLITSLTGSSAQSIVLDIIVPVVGIAFCLIILQVHFQIGGNYPTGQPVESRHIVTSLFRARDVRDVGPIDRTAVLTTARTTEEIEIETGTEMVQSDMIGRNKSRSLPTVGVFRL